MDLSVDFNDTGAAFTGQLAVECGIDSTSRGRGRGEAFGDWLWISMTIILSKTRRINLTEIQKGRVWSVWEMCRVEIV